MLMMTEPEAKERYLFFRVAFPHPSCVTLDKPLNLSEHLGVVDENYSPTSACPMAAY